MEHLPPTHLAHSEDKRDSTCFFSLVIPLFNEEEVVSVLKERLLSSLDSITDSWEVIFVDDGSGDKTLQKLLPWCQSEPRVRVVELSRNFGHQNALLAGLAESRGELIGVMDGDLQDPPEHLAGMVKRIASGLDVVFAVRRDRKEGVILRATYWLAYRTISAMSDHRLPYDSGDFCVMRRPVADEILRSKEHNLYLRGLRSWVGFRQEAFPYERQFRAAGSPKYSHRHLLRLARDGVFGFTKLPIKLITWAAVALILFSFGWLVLPFRAFGSEQVGDGDLSSIIAVMCLLGGVQLLAIAIVGGYLLRILDEARDRPRYVVRKVHSQSGD